MSRGLGRVEREVLTWLRENPNVKVWLSDLREALYPPPNLPKGEPMSRERMDYVIASHGLSSHHEAVDRAVRSLERKGLVRSVMHYRRRGCPKVAWLTERERPRSYGRTC